MRRRGPEFGEPPLNANIAVEVLEQVEGRVDRNKKCRDLSRTLLRLLSNQEVLKCVVPFLIILCILSITVVPAGHVGVVDFFGSVADTPLEPGLNLVNPLAVVIRMTVQTQIISMSEDVPTKEGMDVHLEAAALINLRKNAAVELYKTVGKKYLDTVVVPQFRSVLRSISSAHDAKDLYTTNARTIMSKTLHDELTNLLDKRGFDVAECPLKKLVLPTKLHEAIEEKLKAEQASQMMEFVLQKQEQEAARMIIEANGIAEYQRIVSKDIDERLLRWKGVQATEALARSPNAKIVIIGSGTQGGLPLILNPSTESSSAAININNDATTTTAKKKLSLKNEILSDAETRDSIARNN